MQPLASSTTPTSPVMLLLVRLISLPFGVTVVVSIIITHRPHRRRRNREAATANLFIDMSRITATHYYSVSPPSFRATRYTILWRKRKELFPARDDNNNHNVNGGETTLSPHVRQRDSVCVCVVSAGYKWLREERYRQYDDGLDMEHKRTAAKHVVLSVEKSIAINGDGDVDVMCTNPTIIPSNYW